MFEPDDRPRLFGIPPGADFPAEVATGVLAHLADTPPEALSRVHIIVNTRRMQRRLRAIFASGDARALPRIGLLTDMDDWALDANLPDRVDPLRRRLELADLVAALLDADPTLAPRASLFDLADSLANLIDEMQGEGVPPDVIQGLDTGDVSGHWERSKRFLSLVIEYLEGTNGHAADPEALQRLALDHVLTAWASDPPQHPIIVAGSTGSRGTTSLLMEAVARLPQGAVILPGFDDELPGPLWNTLAADPSTEDHPQYRFAALLNALGVTHTDVQPWGSSAPDKQRNRLISLSLRPAPVTDQWLAEGRRLGDLTAATRDMTLIEAPNARIEATAIAVAMRDAVSRGQSVALVTPDRTLGRRVTAALARWDIVPDDSAGRPLSQTPPGRLLRHVASLLNRPTRSEDLIALLRHPLARTDGTDRGQHLLMTQELELFLRKSGVVQVTQSDLDRFSDAKPERSEWVAWLADLVRGLGQTPAPKLQAHIQMILRLTETLASGPQNDGSGALWDKEAGRKCKDALGALLAVGETGPEVSLADTTRLLDRALQAENVRNSDDSRPDVMIWGTLEARVQGADVVVLGGLNEGTWPGRPAPDPWLNRRMRRAAGLLLPERQIGLSGHDYQQAIAAKKVVLSRALKDDDAEAVASRWLIRLTNLLEGLAAQKGDRALREMRQKGASLIRIAKRLDQPDRRTEPAPRPAPAPPLHLRPKVLSVTEIEKLIRDPYAIYARHVLGLRTLDPIRPQPTAAMRGTVLHEIVRRLMGGYPFSDTASIETQLVAHAQNVLAESIPWPATRSLWMGHIKRIAPRYASDEWARGTQGEPAALEVWGQYMINGGPFGVKGKADRIDRLHDDRLAIYDYKSGGPPTALQIQHFQRQLPIEAVMAEAGAFENIPPEDVAFVGYIGLNRQLKQDRHEMVADDKRDLRTVSIKAQLLELLESYAKLSKGYASRRAMEKMRWDGDYDHLARLGEWDVTEWPTRIDLT